MGLVRGEHARAQALARGRISIEYSGSSHPCPSSFAPANNLQAFLTQFSADGTADISIDPADLSKYQLQIQQNGLSGNEIKVGQYLGMDATVLEAIRQDRLAITTDDLANKSFTNALSDVSDAASDLGQLWMALPALLRVKTSWSWAHAIATRMKSDGFQWTTGLRVLPGSSDE